jgi:FAD/FMN-containing dehydrogenase
MANPILGPLRRLGTAVANGPEGAVVNAVEGLLERPHDEGRQQNVIQMLFDDSRTFMQSLLAHFTVPASGMATSAAADAFPCGTAKRWQNYVGTQTAEPFEIACPTSLSELQAVLQKAAALGCPVRAAGSHHSWSDAALTDGIAVETHGLVEPIAPADVTLLKNPAGAEFLYRVSGGMTIQNLNTALNDRGLALINMGGYDGQTLAGVISTSTHGSGLSIGAFPSFAEALIVIDGAGRMLQIEKSDGITDPAKFAAHANGVQLIQDDKVFQACAVGMGCLGIIYAVILRVRSQYYLSETRTKHKWTDLREQLREGSILRNFSRVEVIVNPHVIDGANTCLLTLRKEVPKPDGPDPPKPFRDVFAEMIAGIPGAGDALAALFQTFPALSPQLVEDAINNLEDSNEFIALSYEMLNIGAANGFPAVSSEIGVDLDRHVEAVDAVLAIAAQARAEGAYHSGVIALRYVAPSPGFLSMQPRETCMIELPFLRGVFGSDSLPWRYEKALVEKFGGRPHWGQTNFLTGSHNMLETIYGKQNVSDWMDVFQTFNPGGQFYSRFTDRVGFSSHTRAAAGEGGGA